MEQPLAAGQVWACGAMDSTPALTYTIGYVCKAGDLSPALAEQDPDLQIVCLSARPDASETDTRWKPVTHMPFSSRAVGQPPDRLLHGNGLPEEGFTDGFTEWLNLFLDGEAGIFTVPVSQAYGMIMFTVEHGETEQ